MMDRRWFLALVFVVSLALLLLIVIVVPGAEQSNTPLGDKVAVQIQARVPGIVLTSNDDDDDNYNHNAAQICLRQSFEETHSPLQWSLSLLTEHPMEEETENDETAPKLLQFRGMAKKQQSSGELSSDPTLKEDEDDEEDADDCPFCPPTTISGTSSISSADIPLADLRRRLEHRLWEDLFCSCLHHRDREASFLFASRCELQVAHASPEVVLQDVMLLDFDNDAAIRMSVVATWTSHQEDADITHREEYEAQACLVDSFHQAQQQAAATIPLNDKLWELPWAWISSYDQIQLVVPHHRRRRRMVSQSSNAGLPPRSSLRNVMEETQHQHVAYYQTTLEFIVAAVPTVTQQLDLLIPGDDDDDDDMFHDTKVYYNSYCPLCLPTAKTAAVEEVLQDLSVEQLSILSYHLAWEESFCQCLERNNNDSTYDPYQDDKTRCQILIELLQD
jgi:hypothetical protein